MRAIGFASYNFKNREPSPTAALSREATNKNGGKMYIQEKVEEYADEIFERLDNGAHVYFCGFKGMRRRQFVTS